MLSLHFTTLRLHTLVLNWELIEGLLLSLLVFSIFLLRDKLISMYHGQASRLSTLGLSTFLMQHHPFIFFLLLTKSEWFLRVPLISPMQNPYLLNFFRNSIDTISPGAFNFPSAEAVVLSLASNQISYIPPGTFDQGNQ